MPLQGCYQLSRPDQVINYLTATPLAAVHDARRRIMTALHQDADVDARHIAVTLSGNAATLTGKVVTWLQRESAERAAAMTPSFQVHSTGGGERCAHPAVQNREPAQSKHLVPRCVKAQSSGLLSSC
jgi:hypothetical protein